MPVITLPDGSQRSFDAPISVHDVAADIGPGLAKAAIALGHIMFYLSWPDFGVLDPAIAGHWANLARVPGSWFVGSTIVGVVTNWITIGMLVPLFRLIPVRGGSGLALQKQGD